MMLGMKILMGRPGVDPTVGLQTFEIGLVLPSYILNKCNKNRNIGLKLQSCKL